MFDDQDSGNICFGVNNGNEKLFIKFAGAPTSEYSGEPIDAINTLKSTVPLYQTIHHKCLIEYIDSFEISNGFAMIFRWADGKCMGRMYDSHILENYPRKTIWEKCLEATGFCHRKKKY